MSGTSGTEAASLAIGRPVYRFTPLALVVAAVHMFAYPFNPVVNFTITGQYPTAIMYVCVFVYMRMMTYKAPSVKYYVTICYSVAFMYVSA